MSTRPDIVEQILQKVNHRSLRLKTQEIQVIASILQRIESDIKTLIDGWDGTERLDYGLSERLGISILKMQIHMRRGIRELFHATEKDNPLRLSIKCISVGISQKEFMNTLTLMSAPSDATKRFTEEIITISLTPDNRSTGEEENMDSSSSA